MGDFISGRGVRGGGGLLDKLPPCRRSTLHFCGTQDLTALPVPSPLMPWHSRYESFRTATRGQVYGPALSSGAPYPKKPAP